MARSNGETSPHSSSTMSDSNKNGLIPSPPHTNVNPHKSNISNFNKFKTSFIAGALAGAIAKTTIAPLDRTKINFQSSENFYSMRNAARFLSQSFQQDGFLSLWRGNTATMARIVPYSAVQFSSHEQYKRLLGVDTHPNSYHPSTQVDSSKILRFISGSLAGVTAVAWTYPLDFIRARMAVTKKRRYHTLYHACKTVVKEEGILGLYRGFTPTMLGSIPYSGTAFFTYEMLQREVRAITGRSDIHPGERLICGALAGIIGQTSSYPLDIVRRRMQTGLVMGHPEYSDGIWKTIMIVYRHEGVFHGLYKGLSMNWIKGPIASGISFTVFDILQRTLRKVSYFKEE